MSCKGGEGAGDAGRVLRWVSSHDLAPGGSVSLRLPAELAGASRDGLVHVAALRDGRRCILLKIKIGYKDNFDGLLACSDALRPGELAANDAASRQLVALPGYGIFEELYVRRRIDGRTFEVFFDLH